MKIPEDMKSLYGRESLGGQCNEIIVLTLSSSSMGEWDTAQSVTFTDKGSISSTRYRQRLHLQHTISSLILLISCVDRQNFLLVLRERKQKWVKHLDTDSIMTMKSKVLMMRNTWAWHQTCFTCVLRKLIDNPLQCSCLVNPRDVGAWWAAVYGVVQSWTRLKRLSSSKIYTINIT